MPPAYVKRQRKPGRVGTSTGPNIQWKVRSLSPPTQPGNQRESRRCILEQPEGDRPRAPHDAIGLSRCNRFPATAR